MFDPKDSLTFARSCERSNPSTEAAHRSAISRAYYAAFLSVRAYCDDEDIIVRGDVARSHDNVIRAMWEFPHHNKFDMAKELKRLKKLRENADYDLSYRDAERDSQKAVDDAEDFINWIGGLPSSKQQLVQRIRHRGSRSSGTLTTPFDRYPVGLRMPLEKPHP